jgi:hypothetical protein
MESFNFDAIYREVKDRWKNKLTVVCTIIKRILWNGKAVFVEARFRSDIAKCISFYVILRFFEARTIPSPREGLYTCPRNRKPSSVFTEIWLLLIAFQKNLNHSKRCNNCLSLQEIWRHISKIKVQKLQKKYPPWEKMTTLSAHRRTDVQGISFVHRDVLYKSGIRQMHNMA